MVSAGRHSELQALVFDSNQIQFKPKVTGVTLYFSPEFIFKNQKPTQTNDPLYIPADPTGMSEFGLLTAKLELLGTTIGTCQSTLS